MAVQPNVDQLLILNSTLISDFLPINVANGRPYKAQCPGLKNWTRYKQLHPLVTFLTSDDRRLAALAAADGNVVKLAYMTLIHPGGDIILTARGVLDNIIICGTFPTRGYDITNCAYPPCLAYVLNKMPRDDDFPTYPHGVALLHRPIVPACEQSMWFGVDVVPETRSEFLCLEWSVADLCYMAANCPGFLTTVEADMARVAPKKLAEVKKGLLCDEHDVAITAHEELFVEDASPSLPMIVTSVIALHSMLLQQFV